MKLVFLYGLPASGKLTIARELAGSTGWGLSHNHLTVDLVLSVCDFGSPSFIALREEIWFAVIRRALADQLAGLIFTFNPENSVPQRFIDELFTEVSASGGEVIPIEIVASEAEIERRLSAPSRRAHGKLVDLALYRRLRGAGVFTTPVIPAPRLRIDSEKLSPAEAAAEIARIL